MSTNSISCYSWIFRFQGNIGSILVERLIHKLFVSISVNYTKRKILQLKRMKSSEKKIKMKKHDKNMEFHICGLNIFFRPRTFSKTIMVQ
eukprot:UN18807